MAKKPDYIPATPAETKAIEAFRKAVALIPKGSWVEIDEDERELRLWRRKSAKQVGLDCPELRGAHISTRAGIAVKLTKAQCVN